MASALQFSATFPGAGYTAVGAAFPLSYQFSPQGVFTPLGGAGSVNITHLEVNAAALPPPCVYQGASPSGGSGYVEAVDLGLNRPYSATNLAGLSVLFNPFLLPPQENYAIQCPPAGGSTLYGFWTAYFGMSLPIVAAPTRPGEQEFILTGWELGTNSAQIATLSAGNTYQTPAGVGQVGAVFHLIHAPAGQETNCMPYPPGPGDPATTRNTPVAYVDLTGRYQTSGDVPAIDTRSCPGEMVVFVTRTNGVVPCNYAKAALDGLGYNAPLTGFFWCPPPANSLAATVAQAGSQLAQFLFDLKNACPCLSLRVVGMGDGAIYTLAAARSLHQNPAWEAAGFKLASLDLLGATADADVVGTQNSWDRDQYGPEIEAEVNVMGNYFNTADRYLSDPVPRDDCAGALILGGNGASVAPPSNYHEANDPALPFTGSFEFSQTSLAPLVAEWRGQQSATPAESFTWTIEPRFGMRDPNNPQILLYRYDSDYANPANGYTVTFDASGMLGGASPSESSIEWNIQGTNGLARQVQSTGCGPRLTLNLPLAAYTVAVSAQTPGGPALSSTQQVVLRDYLIASLGDSYASGEGNPDQPAAVLAAGIVPIPVLTGNALWVNDQCHRSAYSSRAQLALRLEREDPHSSVTYIDFSCSGSTITNVLSGWNPGPIDDYGNSPSIPSQVGSLAAAVGGKAGRTIDALIISIGGNDIGFADIVSHCVMDGMPWPIGNAGVNEAPGDAKIHSDFETAMDILGGNYAKLGTALSENLNVAQTYITEYPNPATDSSGATCNDSPSIPGLLSIPVGRSRNCSGTSPGLTPLGPSRLWKARPRIIPA
jgi:hypothetical protein